MEMKCKVYVVMFDGLIQRALQVLMCLLLNNVPMKPCKPELHLTSKNSNQVFRFQTWHCFPPPQRMPPLCLTVLLVHFKYLLLGYQKKHTKKRACEKSEKHVEDSDVKGIQDQNDICKYSSFDHVLKHIIMVQQTS